MLATVLGYDGNIFHRCLKRKGIDISNQKSRYSEAELKEWLDNHVFDYELEHVFNQYAAGYNVKLIKRALAHLYHRSLTYNEINNSRIAFHTVTARERQTSLTVDKTQVQMALKMVNKVLAPTKLHHMLQAMSQHFDSPNTLNLYDFLDIVARAEDMMSHDLTTPNNGKTNEPNLEALFETPYHQLLTTLDTHYKASLTKLKAKRINTSKIPVVSTSQQQLEEHNFLAKPSYLQTIPQREAVKRAIQSRDAMTPNVTKTAMMINLARAGYRSILQSEGHKTLSRLTTSHQSRL